MIEEYALDHDTFGLLFGLKYVFEVFVGTGDLGGVGGQSTAIVFMVFATFFGTLILTNLCMLRLH